MKIHELTVAPNTPPELFELTALANNLWFSWTPHVHRLFATIDREYWEASERNPMKMLGIVPQEKLAAVAKDENYRAELDALYDRFHSYMSETSWFDRTYGKREQPTIAYFCCEFGLHESVPIYSGGLGILAGDHMKSTSDLGVPLVGIGLFYHEGYFRQRIAPDGTQHEWYPRNDPHTIPVDLVVDENGEAITSTVEIGGKTVCFQIWQIAVGRTRIFLLDTDLEGNPEEHRSITQRLYEGNRDVRVRQEVLLGIGGVRALEVMGIRPKVFHVNEGHSAFLLLERVRMLMVRESMTFQEARTFVWGTSLFTTHTPVPAGNETFEPQQLYPYLTGLAKELGLEWHEFLALGRNDGAGENEPFSMTVLALRLCAYANGVAKLHGEVARTMWHALYSGMEEQEVPIGSVTNGVHARTWLNPHLQNLFLRYMGPTNVNELADFTMFKKAESIPNQELWEVHNFKRGRFVRWVRRYIRRGLVRDQAGAAEMHAVDDLLDPNALTIGFARRFAEYKRGNLMLRDRERLRHILSNTERPVQIIVAGKAHPSDSIGKGILADLSRASKEDGFRGRLILLEDYSIEVGRRMVKGVDVWLNNPRRPQEASGTSGMKVALNGGLNFSVLDGWWDEAYTPEVGFTIGGREGANDSVDASRFYDVLEQQIIPKFFDRNEKGIPVEWVQMMKASICELGTEFTSHRMVRDYVNQYYLPAERNSDHLSEDGYANAKALSVWLTSLEASWEQVSVGSVSVGEGEILKGVPVPVEVTVNTGTLTHNDLACEVEHGSLEHDGEFAERFYTPLQALETNSGTVVFSGNIECARGGRYGYRVRLLPGHPSLPTKMLSRCLIRA